MDGQPGETRPESSTNRTFAEALELGRVTEILIAAWLRGRGWKVLPAYEFTGLQGDKAPKLLGNPESLISPDLLGIFNGSAKWFEVKWKQSSDFTRITQRQETGIPLHHWRDYLQVKKESGLEVYLIFAHEQQNEVLGQELEKLAAFDPREYGGSKMDRGGMVFFSCDWFVRLCTLSELRAKCQAQI